jgi:hypothetical protein
VLITNTAPDNTSCANVGSGSQVYKDGECNFRTIIGSSDISVTQQTNTITIDYNGTSSGVTSLTSGNDAIVLSGSTGAITITPEWQLLCEDIASSGDTSMNCSTFVSHRYYYIITYQRIQTSTATLGLQINGDSGNNYAFRFSTNNGAETTTTNTNQCLTTGSLNNGQFGETLYQFSNNESGQEKTGYGQTSGVTASGAGNAPYRVEIACKWANTANNITDFDMVRIAGTGTLASGYLVVYGHD